MQFFQYIKPYVGKAFILGSGILLGVNNYEILSKSKDYLLPSFEKQSDVSQISYLEKLVELKDE